MTSEEAWEKAESIIKRGFTGDIRFNIKQEIAAALLDAQALALEEYVFIQHLDSDEVREKLGECRGNCPECERLLDIEILKESAEGLREWIIS